MFNIDLTIIEEETAIPKTNIPYQDSNIIKGLNNKIKSLETLILTYKKEIFTLKQNYCKNNIENILKENNNYKFQIELLNKEIKDYKHKIKKFTFAYNYLSKEFESLNKFYNIIKSKDPTKEDNFIYLMNIVKGLTNEIFDKDLKIQKLNETITKISNTSINTSFE